MIKSCALCGFDVEVDPSDDLLYGDAHEQCIVVLEEYRHYKFHFILMWQIAEDWCPKLIKFLLDFKIPSFILDDIKKQKKDDEENRFVADP